MFDQNIVKLFLPMMFENEYGFVGDILVTAIDRSLTIKEGQAVPICS